MIRDQAIEACKSWLANAEDETVVVQFFLELATITGDVRTEQDGPDVAHDLLSRIAEEITDLSAKFDPEEYYKKL